ILKNIKNDKQLLASIKFFKKEYEKTKSLSQGKLISYLYQQKSLSYSESLRSGVKIKVQPASIQQRKQKENVDLSKMKAQKKKKAAVKPHSLKKNISDNKPN
ncbi:16266_t:CDS:1, partial [Racocetra persica]